MVYEFATFARKKSDQKTYSLLEMVQQFMVMFIHPMGPNPDKSTV